MNHEEAYLFQGRVKYSMQTLNNLVASGLKYKIYVSQE